MRKNEIIPFKKEKEIQLDQHWNRMEYRGLAEQNFMSFMYYKGNGISCKILVPYENNPVQIMKYDFEVLSATPDEVILKYLGRHSPKK
mgnify:CR=1 FL=1